MAKQNAKDFPNGEAPSIEYFPEKKTTDDDLLNYINTIYEDSVENLEKYKSEWKANKKAYATSNTLTTLEGSSAFFDEDGTPTNYCSSIVSDKMEDVVAIQLAGRPTVYPLPHINQEIDYSQLGPQAAEAPDMFVKDIWSFCFKDLQERLGMQELNVNISTDARLYAHSFVKITQKYDFETQDQDVCIQICKPGSVTFDPMATNMRNCKYLFHRDWNPVYEAIQKYPKFKDEIISSVGGNSELRYESETQDEQKSRNMSVCICEGYLRDLTQEEVEYEEVIGVDEMGQPITETVTESVYKYPTGRRITFLEVNKGIVILKDENNPYNKFPFEVFAPKSVSWSLIGRNEASPIRALQQADDYVFQQMLSNIKKLGAGVMLYDKKGLADPEKIKMMVGEMIPVDNLNSIKFEISKGITMDAERAHGLILNAAREISGVEAVSEGKPAGSVTSGIGISLLQESTNRKIRVSADIYSEFLQRVWKQAADIMIDIYKAGRPLRVSDTDGIPVTLPADLNVMTDSIDVSVDSFTALALDPVSMSNLALSLLQVRDANNVPVIDRRLLAEWIKIPGLREAMTRVTEQSDQRRQEEMQLKQMQAEQGMQGSGADAPQPNEMFPGQPGELNQGLDMGGMQRSADSGMNMSPEQMAMMMEDLG